MNFGGTLTAIFAPERCSEPMSAAEFAFWIEFRAKHGFPDDRADLGIAIAGAAICASHGAKVKPSELLPKFGEAGRSGSTTGQVKAWLSGIRGVKVRRIPKNGTPYEVKAPAKPAKPIRKRGLNGR